MWSIRLPGGNNIVFFMIAKGELQMNLIIVIVLIIILAVVSAVRYFSNDSNGN